MNLNSRTDRIDHSDNARTDASYMLCSTTRKNAKRSSIIVDEVYRLPNTYLRLMNLRMRFQQIAFVFKRIVPLG